MGISKGLFALKAAMACGVSVLAIAGLAGPAAAQQATPGSAECPRTGAVVTCSGDVRNGFRSNNDATMRELRFRDLTQPITGPIELRHQSDLLFDLAPGTILNSTNPPPSAFPVFSVSSGRPEAPVFVQLDYTRNLTLNFRSAAEINATFDFAAPGSHTAGAIFIEARNVDLVNTGRITVTSPSYSGSITAIRGAPRGIQILNSDRATIDNSGAMSLSGSAGALIAAKSRDLSVTNSGALTLSGNDFSLRPFDLSVASTNAGPARIALTNSAAIRSTATDFYGADERATSNLQLLGRGAITVANTGAWTNAAMQVLAQNENRTDDLSISIENDGILDGSGIFATASIACATFCLVNDLIGDEVSVTLANRAALNKAPLAIFAQGLRAQALLTNSGNLAAVGPIRNDPNFNRGGFALTYLLSATGDSAMAGSAAVRLTNNGELLMTDSRFGSLMTARSSHALEVMNSGTLTARGMTGVTGIRLHQGDHVYNRGPGADNEEYAFDAGTSVTNSGAMSLGGVGGDVFGIWAAETYGDVAVTSSGPIGVTNTASENFSVAGVALKGFSDMQVTNTAAISATGSAGAAAGVFFGELSFSDRVVASQAGRLRGYDRAADLSSRVSIDARADITASGPGGYGVFGFLGVVDDITDRRYATTNISPDTGTTDEIGSMAISNDRAVAAIAVASGTTITGGTGSGSAIGVQGAGTVSVINAGTILGRGSAGSGGIVLGDLVTETTFGGTVPTRDANRFLNLVDSVNTGTIRSDLGYGIWAQNGSITNLINRGTIHGGQGSIAAARTSSVINQAGAILDGRIALTGAGSTLSNAGTIRTTTPGFVTHEINGNYTQTGAGTLALGAGEAGRDRMNVTGNFTLDGIFNLTLAAPSATPVITVGGNLTLDGTLNVSAGTGFGEGVYRLFDYGGTLTDNGLAIGALPGGTNVALQTSVAGQINLLVAGSLQFWDGPDTAPDGVVDGGSGTWNTSRTNWTRANGDVNAAWGGSFAVFQGQAGTVTVDPAGVTATGLQFAVNGYRIEGGPLTINGPSLFRAGDGSAAGASIVGTIASVIAGAGGIDKTDLGTLVLTGANSFSGGVRVSSGVLQVGADNALGAAANAVTLDGGTLRLTAAITTARSLNVGATGGTLDIGTNPVTWSGIVGGTGSLTKAGSGTLTLSGNSSAFTGTTSLTGGLLNLTGSLGGSLVVQSGARLGGTGTVGNLTIASGGILAPGNSAGTLSATGNVIFRAGSIYEVEIAAAGGRDLLATAGTATIEGGTVRVTTLDPQTQYTDGARYTFLTATGGRTGTFAGLEESSAFLDFALGYDSTSAFLTVQVIRTFPDVAATFNQRQASGALMAFNNGGADALAVYNQLLLLDAAPARAAFDLASGEIYAVTLASSVRQAGADVRRLLALAHAGSGEGWGIWGSLSGQDGEVESDGNGGRFTHDAISGTIGGDYRGPGDGWAAGIGVSFGSRDAELRDRNSRVSSDGWQLSGYGRYGSGGAGFTATVSGTYAQDDADVARGVSTGPITRGATSRVDVDGWAVAGELRYGLPSGGALAFGPLARVVLAGGSLGSFTETGANSLSLTGGNGNDHDRTRFGGGLFGRWADANGSLDITAAYITGDDDPAEIGLAMAGAPAAPYRVRAARGAAEGLEFGLAGRYSLGGGWSIGADLSAFTGSDERQLSGSATIGWRF